MAKSRNFSAEYQRRNELAKQRGFKSYYAERQSRGISKGLTPSQARGAPRKGELPASIKNVRDIKRNWIATKIKEMARDIDFKDEGQSELYDRTIKDYQQWKRGGYKDIDRHRVTADIKEYMDVYNDEYDFDIGESPK